MSLVALAFPSIALFVVVAFLSWCAVERARTEPLGLVASPWIILPFFFGLLTCFVLLLGWEYLFFGGIVAVGVILGFIHPIFAVSFFVANILIRPWEFIPPGTAIDFLPRILAGSSLISWLIYRVRKGNLKIVLNLPCLILLAFVVTLGISAAIAFNPFDSLDFLANAFIPIAVTFFILLNSISDVGSIKTFRGALILSVVAVVLKAIYLTGEMSGGSSEGSRLSSVGMWSNANDIAALIVLVIPLAIVPALWKGRDALSVLGAITLSAILLWGLWLSQSRGALLAMAVGVTVGLLMRYRLSVRTLLYLAFAGIVPLVLYLGISRESSDLQGSSELRLNYLITGVKMLRQNPIFGVGPGNYPLLFEQFTSRFDEWGQRTAHSTWILAMSEGGLLGLALIACFFAVILKRAWRLRREMPELVLALITYGVAMSFLSHTYMIILYLLGALALGADRVYRVSRMGRSAVFGICITISLASLYSEQALAAPRLQLTAVASGDKPLGDFAPSTSAHVRVYASRGETRNIIVRLEGDGCELLKMPEFRSASGEDAQITPRLFLMKTITTRQPSFPGAYVGPIHDPVIPVPSKQVCATTPTPAWYWVDLAVPTAVRPGDYTGILEVTGSSVKIDLTVWKMTMPERFALPAYSELTTWFNLLGHYGKWNEGEAELAAAYSKEMLDHRIVPIKSAIALPPIIGAPERPELDLTSFPDKQQSFAAVALEGRPDWAYFDLPTVRPEEIYQEKTQRYLSAVERSIRPLVRRDKAFFYLWDEPKQEMQQDLIALAKMVRRYAPSMKIMVTTPWSPQLDPLVDIFCPVMDSFAPLGPERSETYQRIKRHGGEFWWYISCMSHGCDALEDSGTPDMMIDRRAVYIRSIPWLSAQYAVDAFLYYSVNNGYQYYPRKDPWLDQWDFSGNGDGTLFYPGRPGEHGQIRHGPISSVRLKLWREASFDAEYIRWITSEPNIPEWFLSDSSKLTQSVTEWSREYDRYEALRIKIGEYLDRS